MLASPVFHHRSHGEQLLVAAVDAVGIVKQSNPSSEYPIRRRWRWCLHPSHRRKSLEALSRLQNKVSSSFADAIAYRRTLDMLGHGFGASLRCTMSKEQGEEGRSRMASAGWNAKFRSKYLKGKAF